MRTPHRAALAAIATAVIVLPPLASGKETDRTATPPVPVESSPQLTSLVEEGRDLLDARQHGKAIARFDEAITAFEYQYRDSSKRIFCARTPEEALFYIAGAIDKNEKQDAVVLSQDWAEAHFLRGYALLEQGQLAQARASVDRALELSPMNSNYMAEIGFMYGAEKDWSKSLETYEASLAAARLSPQDVRGQDTCRALRGQGYALIEMERLDEAEKKYHACLKLLADDPASQGELQYIEQLRSRNKTQ